MVVIKNNVGCHENQWCQILKTWRYSFFYSTVGFGNAILLELMEAAYAYKCSGLPLNAKGCEIDLLLTIV